MNIHKNARLTPIGRERIVRQVASGQTPKAVSEAAGVCPRTIRKWVDRYRIEDHSRIAFAKILGSERKHSATAFLKAALAYYASLGVKVERVMTDNGSCYKSFAFLKTCKRLGLRHIRTKPYAPRTNGKAER